ncbi:hypothetical protein IQ238_00655 [Pleurocapsales cyanobacterium LEGE 06147]|nr:hypothetical protein [Pleurocapsales cyanobacterium LEGE 06147]
MANNNKTARLAQTVQNQDASPVYARVVSQTPGRIRLRVDHSYRQKHKLEPIADALKKKVEVYRVKANITSGSITVHHGRELLSGEEIRAILKDLGIILVEIEDIPIQLNGNSSAAAGITKATTDLNQRVKKITQGAIDLRFIMPFCFAMLALRQLWLKGLQFEAIPWYVLAWYSFDSFIKLNQSGESLSQERSS